MADRSSKSQRFSRQDLIQAATAYGYVTLWISLSALVILYNKQVASSLSGRSCGPFGCVAPDAPVALPQGVGRQTRLCFFSQTMVH